LEQLDFMDVWQEEHGDKRIRIHFEVNYRLYFMEVMKENGVFKPYSVLHESTSGECPFCRQVSGFYGCPFFKTNISDLFAQLIDYPAIRLHWLFVPHQA